MADFEISTQHQSPALYEWKKSVDRYTAKRRPGAPLPPWTCAHCQSEFTGRKRKFCGDECAADAKNKRKAESRSRVRAFKSIRRPNPIINGFRECLDCRQTLPLSAYTVKADPKCKSGQTIRGVCKACERIDAINRAKKRTPESRIEERRRAAEKNGRAYTPGGSPLQKTPFHVLQSRAAKANAKQAWRWWLTQAPDGWMAAYYGALGRPWSNPRLNESEKYKIRYNTDPVFNLSERLRNQVKKRQKRARTGESIRSAFKRNGRCPSLERAFGYTIPQLRDHLERQFTKGMTWDHFLAGEIHIDHIHPQSEFDFSDDKQWRKCWCLSNLRPLWGKENLEKSNRVLFLL